jgi:hypothetical protein
MGTHGRTAVTKDGNHDCCEVTMDGHSAADHILAEIASGNPTLQYSTMSDNTDECDHGTNFGHIDYDRKIIYSGLSDPELINEDQDEYGDWNPEAIEYGETVAAGAAKLKREGWRFAWGCGKCPAEYECVNSIPVSVQEFIDDTPNYHWQRFIHGWGPDQAGGSGSHICPPDSEQSYESHRLVIESPIPAVLEVGSSGYSKMYAQCIVGRTPLRSDSEIRRTERMAEQGDADAQRYFDIIAPPIYQILPVQYWAILLSMKGDGDLGAEIRRMAEEGDATAFGELIQDWLDDGHPAEPLTREQWDQFREDRAK